MDSVTINDPWSRPPGLTKDGREARPDKRSSDTETTIGRSVAELREAKDDTEATKVARTAAETAAAAVRLSPWRATAATRDPERQALAPRTPTRQQRSGIR